MTFEYDKKIGENIKLLREKRGMTQEQLSSKLQLVGCDITRSAMAKIEVGQRHIYSYEIKKLKEIFGISFDELFV